MNNNTITKIYSIVIICIEIEIPVKSATTVNVGASMIVIEKHI